MKKQCCILCIGNSHTAGFPLYDPLLGGNPASSYQYWLKKALIGAYPSTTFELVNQGVCGDTSGGIGLRLKKALQDKMYDLVIMSGGTNDLGIEPDSTIVSNLKQGYQACKKSSIPLIVATIPPVNIVHYMPRVKVVNRAIRLSAQKCRDVFLVDWFSRLRDKRDFLSNNFNSGDGVHLSIEGYRCIGELLLPVVSKALSLG